MNLKSLKRLSAYSIVLSAGLATAASAAVLQIEITNNQNADGLYLTPLLSVFHNGSFDSFDAGKPASPQVELLAEEGDPSGVAGLAGAAGATYGVVTGPKGFGGAPVIDPGETAYLNLSVDPTKDRYFSFLSMVIPSNDTFIGNDNPVAYEIFDAVGAFTGIGPISVYDLDAWDAGTELNDGFGAPFNTAGGTATDANGVITPAPDGLFFLNGQETVAGTTVDLGEGRNLLATIAISEVPLPAGFPLLLVGLGAFGLMRRRNQE